MNEKNQLGSQPAPENPEQSGPISEADQTPEGQEPDEKALQDAEAGPGEVSDGKPEEKAEKKPPTRFQLLLRKALIGLGIVAVIFLAGFLTDHFVRYVPLADTLGETRSQLEDANLALTELEAENDRLNSLNRTAADEIATLEAELSAVRANALFYQVLVDVNNARLALFMEDIEGAQAALADTQDNLEALLPAISEVDPELALSLPRRLDLIVSGLARNPETGRIDLELFTKDLLELQPLLEVE